MHRHITGDSNPDKPCDFTCRRFLPLRHPLSATAASLYIVLSLWINVAASSPDSTKHWVGTWACAPYKTQAANKPPTSFDEKTLRQIVRVSIGGDTLRVKFSNITCSQPVIMRSVNIAASPDGTKSAVTASTITMLTFNGDSSVTINAKSEVYSDPVAFDLKPSMRVAITIYYGQCKSTDDMTFHYGSRTNSYYISGDKTASVDFGGSTPIERWFTICGIDVLAPKTAVAVAAIGNSITDGSTLSGGLQNRWTDMFSEALLKDTATDQVGVLNLGIGATLVTSASNGADAGTVRFKHDVLEQAGVHWVIIFYGVNDICSANKAPNEVINGIKQMINQTRAKDTTIKVYGATITPFNGNTYYSSGHESARQNFNNWIRTDTSLDGFIDFDKTVRNPNDATRFQQSLQSDWLHPNAAGHKVMGEYIDRNMFIPPPPVRVIDAAVTSGRAAKGLSATFVNHNTAVAFDLPEESFVSLKVYSIPGKEIAELAGRQFTSGRHTIAVGRGNLAKGMYVYSFKAGRCLVGLKMNFPGY
ncbi:MAG: hypothetical protein JW913_19275 [Chitinispirillaceae bacterium]|nr:hypothetical protein [Chitinispirillaceae bacterium]